MSVVLATAGFVPLVAASLVGAAGGAYWPIAAPIALGGFIGFVCILLVRPTVTIAAKEFGKKSGSDGPEYLAIEPFA